jgi:hypothetical protein
MLTVLQHHQQLNQPPSRAEHVLLGDISFRD